MNRFLPRCIICYSILLMAAAAEDWYMEYAPVGFVGPLPLKAGHVRIVRGGSIHNDFFVRPAVRSSREPHLRYNTLIGMRVLRRY